MDQLDQVLYIGFLALADDPSFRFKEAEQVSIFEFPQNLPSVAAALLTDQRVDPNSLTDCLATHARGGQPQEDAAHNILV